MRRFVLTLLAGTAVLSAAGVVLALQCGSLVNKIEKQLEDEANRHFASVTADAVARGGRPQTYLESSRDDPGIDGVSPNRQRPALNP